MVNGNMLTSAPVSILNVMVVVSTLSGLVHVPVLAEVEMAPRNMSSLSLISSWSTWSAFLVLLHTEEKCPRFLHLKHFALLAGQSFRAWLPLPQYWQFVGFLSELAPPFFRCLGGFL